MLIGWTTGVNSSDSTWSYWLKSSEELRQLTNIVQLHIQDHAPLVRLEGDLISKVRFLHPPKGGRLDTLEVLAARIEAVLMQYEFSRPVIVLHPPALRDEDALVKTIVDRAIGLVRLLERWSISVGIEITGDVPNDERFLRKFEEILKTASASGNIGVILDTEHEVHKGTDLPALASKYKSLVIGVHVKDYDGHPFETNGKRRFVRYGTGIVDFRAVFASVDVNRIPLILEGNYGKLTDLIEDLYLVRTDASIALESRR